MSRPTVAYCLALIEKQNLLIASLEERLKKVENSQFQRNASATKPRNSWRPNGGTNYARFAPDACKYFNKKSVSKQEIYDYINACEVADSE